MGQFGEELRRERESRGIALESISDSTKISGRHLAALEHSQFEKLPGGVFNKGIVRGYARVVGLDEDAWVGRFMSAYQESGQLKDDDANWIEFAENIVKARESERPASGTRLRWAGVFLLLALIAGLGWFVYRFVHERASADVIQAHISSVAPPPRGGFEPRHTERRGFRSIDVVSELSAHGHSCPSACVSSAFG